MGRRSEMSTLVDLAGASDVARERTKVMLLTLGGGWSVRDGLGRLGVSRTRFQDLRRTMLRAAVAALEERPRGRPAGAHAKPSSRVRVLEAEVRDLKHTLKVARAQMDLASCGLLPAIERRKAFALERSGS